MRPTYCLSCLDAFTQKREELKAMPLGEYLETRKTRKLTSSKFSGVTTLCREWNRDLYKTPCQRCGYDKHSNMCHIVALAKTPLDTPLGKINSPDNLLILCPNCHWEFDHLGLMFEDIPKRKC